MGIYANQKSITINREEINLKEDKRQFLSIYTENLSRASRELSGEVPFKLYLYLCANRNGYKLDFSPQNFSRIYGCSVDATKKAIKKLIEARYLIQKKGKTLAYTFYETPQEEEVDIPLPFCEYREFKDGNGKTVALSYAQLYEKWEGKTPLSNIEYLWNKAKVVEVEDND